MFHFHESISIRDRTIQNNGRPFVIAEMACAHDGSVEDAEQIAAGAASAGADAIQLQFFRTDSVVTPAHEAFPVLKKIELTDDQWTKIYNSARKSGISVFACTYDLPSVDLALKLGVDGIKLNSSDLSNTDLLRAVGESAIPLTMGTGASTFEEITTALETISTAGGEKVVLMHGVQNFPTRIEDLNMARMGILREMYSMPVGYHDHTDAFDPFSRVVDLVAVGMGAAVIEKHITLDRSRKGTDHQAALEPQEFREFVALIQKAVTARGTSVSRPFSESDMAYRKFQKKSIVASVDIAEGEVITGEKVSFLRNREPGLSPLEAGSVINRKAARKILKFTNISLDDIQ